MFGILYRMIFWELVRVFALSLTGLTGLFLIAGLIQQATQFGLSPSQLLKVIPLLIPITFPYTIPATTLFASCVVYGRLANDNEAVAIKAAGIDLLTILRPAIAVGLLTSGVTLGLYVSLIPRTQQMLQEQLLQDPEEVLYAMLKRERVFKNSNFPYVIYVRDVQGRRLIDVIVKRRARVRTADGAETWAAYDFIARAREARLIVDVEKGTLSIDPDRWVVAGPNSQLESEGSRPMEIPLPDMFSAKAIKSRPMNLEWDELDDRIAEIREEQHDRERLLAKALANVEMETDPAARKVIVDQIPHYKAQIDHFKRQARSVEYEYYIRPALSAGCLLFAMIGCPVGLWANRADYLSTFVSCFLPTVFVYYPILLAGGGLARDGKVEMAVGVWAANAVAATASILLTWRLIRR